MATADIAAKAVTYKSQSINGSKLVDKSVGAAKLADGAVTSAKIADGTVATADIAAKAVTDAKLSDALAYKINGGGILATPGWYMTGSQSFNLAKKVSEQRSGIVLVFSAYNGKDAQNSYLSAHFVPKQAVAAAPGSGWEFDSDPCDRVGMAKYLYISDSQIKGHDVNANSGTAPSGRKHSNGMYILRWVIGV